MFLSNRQPGIGKGHVGKSPEVGLCILLKIVIPMSFCIIWCITVSGANKNENSFSDCERNHLT